MKTLKERVSESIKKDKQFTTVAVMFLQAMLVNRVSEWLDDVFNELPGEREVIEKQKAFIKSKLK